MDLSTTYLGLELPHPLMPGQSAKFYLHTPKKPPASGRGTTTTTIILSHASKPLHRYSRQTSP